MRPNVIGWLLNAVRPLRWRSRPAEKMIFRADLDQFDEPLTRFAFMDKNNNERPQVKKLNEIGELWT